VEAPFEDLDGVISVVSGYSGGKEKNPTYGEVAGGKTSHRESVQITFDPEVISYAELVDIFWQTYDPTDVGGSFFDRGTQYESAIFFHNDQQKKVAEESKKLLDQSKRFSKPCSHTHHQVYQLLPCGGLPPGLLQKEPSRLLCLPKRFG
jgi:peptide methionine sulfoxide reductase msrA/msrB